MSDLPLFPLKTVVFPGMPMPLHIFEDRYKQMIEECLETKRPFGIVMIEEGSAEYDTHVKPHLVGCTVDIMQVQRLEDGRFFIMTIGQERFRITDLKRNIKPYLVGTVSTLSYRDESPSLLEEAAQQLKPEVIKYLEILARAGKVEVDITQLPDNPEALAGIAASLLDTDMEKKQSLLEINKLSRVLNYLTVIYEQEVKLLRMMPPDAYGVFSLN